MANEKRLTEADEIAYYAIEQFVKENGYPPTVRDLCRIMGKSSTATIQYRLKSLEQKGYIKTTDRGKRTIRITKEIDHAQTVEVVEVVRCKDCKHFIHPTCSDGLCDLDGEHRIIWLNDDFCSYGEKREV